MITEKMQGGGAQIKNTSFCDMLRVERLRRGLTVQEIGTKTKIGQYYIEAMENGQFGRLPSGAYRHSFLRQYARVLGLDEERIMASFQQEYEQPDIPLPQISRKPSSWRLSAVCITALIAAFFGFYHLRERDGTLPMFRTVSKKSVPRTTEALIPETAATEFHTQAKPRDLTHSVHVTLTATEPVWISVKSDELPVYTGTLNRGQPRAFDATIKMTTLVGNAGGLLISFNGKTLGALGDRGEVQLLEFTPETARVVTHRLSHMPTVENDGGRGQED